MTTKNFFTGRYVGELVRTMTASALSGTNAIFISPPGWGKTTIARYAAREMSGGNWSFTALSPSTPPSTVEGIYDPRKYLKGEMERIVTGTASDPSNRINVLDEGYRASDPVFDLLLHILEPQNDDLTLAPVSWITSNFVISDERGEALRDRIAIWLHLYPTIGDVDVMLESFASSYTTGMKLVLADLLPTWDEIAAVRQMVPGKKAKVVLGHFIKAVIAEIAQPPTPAAVNPRHLGQWFNVLFRYNAWATGSDNFDHLEDATKSLMRYLWVQPAKQDWEQWGKKVAGVVDLTGSIIKGIMYHTQGELNKLLDGKKGGSTSDHQALLMQATQLIQKAQREMTERAAGDKRVELEFTRLQSMMMTLIKGEKLDLEF